MWKSSIENLPPFPDDIPTAPIARLSMNELLNGDDKTSKAALEACQTYGFFYLDMRDCEPGRAILTQSEQLLSLAQEAFTPPREEKMKFELQKGVSLFGYKPAGTVKKTDPTLRPDTTEFFNLSKDHMHGVAASRAYPPAIENARPLLKDFTRDAHACGMLVLRTLAMEMGLEPNEFTDRNLFDKPAGDHCRLTKKVPHPADNTNVIGLPSHTDFGSVTILFNWLGGLQIQSRRPDRLGEWEYVKPMEGHAIINLGDAMVMFSNGALKSAKHRVVPAPGEQHDVDRYSIVYFVRPHNEAIMKPVPKFAKGDHVKVGGKVSVGDDPSKIYTAGEWMVKRAIQLGS